MLPSRVNVHPGAVSETDVAAVLLAQLTPTTTASLAAFAEAVNVNVDAEEVPPCCVNTFVCVMLAQAGEHAANRKIKPCTNTAFEIDSRRLRISFHLFIQSLPQIRA
jgi:hypothetical protein